MGTELEMDNSEKYINVWPNLDITEIPEYQDDY